MKPEQHAEYIVQCIREAASMYEDDARKFLAQHDSHVRAEAAADVHRAGLPTFPAGETPENVAKVVRAVDVRLAERGPEAPYGVAEGSEPAAPDFFRPGRTYRSRSGVWTFHCIGTGLHPATREHCAVGWTLNDGAWIPNEMDAESWQHDGWTDVTEGGEPR